TGVTILAVLHLVGGVLLLVGQVMLLANLDRVSQGLNGVGIPPALLVMGVMLLAGIALASGVGMWLGTRWGWWCAAFYYVYSVARNANAFLMVSDLADGLEGGSRGPGYYYAKFGGRVVIHLLLLLYFFKDNVLEYFEAQDQHKGKAIGILIGVTAAIFGISSGISALSS
ncbi:MAG: hypothetical protein ACYTGL_08545, partial [Planctomycetota bacterium]